MDLSELKQSLTLIKVCAICQNEAKDSCSSCKSIHYCSKEHQLSHWKASHKKVCPKMRMVTSPDLGRHFVATRDLKPGTLILRETPVISSPKTPICQLCIVCCKFLGGQPIVTCPICKWSIFCSTDCWKNPIHARNECRFIALFEAPLRGGLLNPQNLILLRAYFLKEKNPSIWAQILDLQGGDKYPNLESLDRKWFFEHILSELIPGGENSIPDLLKFRGILEVNSFGKSIPIPGKEDGVTFQFYLKSSIFSSNCFPNCNYNIDDGPNFPMEIRTTMEVKKGQILSISYDEKGLGILGAVKGQHLGNTGGFICKCPRCVDPTELGIMFSAVKCTGCSKGYLLPVDPLDLHKDAVWKCQNGCKNAKTWTEIDEITEKFDAQIQEFLSNSPIEDHFKTKSFWETLKSTLHPNHWQVCKFEKNLTEHLTLIQEDMSDKQADLYLEMLEHLLEISKVTAPGLSRAKGWILEKLNLAYNGNFNNPGWIIKKGKGERIEHLKRFDEIIVEFMKMVSIFPKIFPPGVGVYSELEEEREFIRNALESENTMNLT